MTERSTIFFHLRGPFFFNSSASTFADHLRVIFLGVVLSTSCNAKEVQDQPLNIIVIFTDDLGYGDLSCFGHPMIKTPNLDRMAIEGQKWTNFYVAASVCTPSRAALLTGRYPIRNGMTSSKRAVLFPDSNGGLPSSEITIAEMLKERGYATAAIGKWHLGHLPEYLPINQGFDYYYGIPYSNDMDRMPGENYTDEILDPYFQADYNHYNVPLIEGTKVIERPVNQHTITHRYTQKAKKFIIDNKDKPFFLYLAHNQPHIPLFSSTMDQEELSSAGLYGDVVEEIDRGVGEIRNLLESLQIDQNTIVMFTSDNGPWLAFKTHGGSAGPLRAGKGTTFEGGQRVPAVIWGPGLVAPGIIHEMGSTLDLLPTFASLTGSEAPQNRKIDGLDLSKVITGEEVQSPRDKLFYWNNDKLFAVRSGKWKLHKEFVSPIIYWNPSIPLKEPTLYDLKTDPAEKYNRADAFPEVVENLEQLMQQHLDDITDPLPDNLSSRSDGTKTELRIK